MVQDPWLQSSIIFHFLRPFASSWLLVAIFSLGVLFFFSHLNPAPFLQLSAVTLWQCVLTILLFVLFSASYICSLIHCLYVFCRYLHIFSWGFFIPIFPVGFPLFYQFLCFHCVSYTCFICSYFDCTWNIFCS